MPTTADIVAFYNVHNVSVGASGCARVKVFDGETKGNLVLTQNALVRVYFNAFRMLSDFLLVFFSVRRLCDFENEQRKNLLMTVIRNNQVRMNVCDLFSVSLQLLSIDRSFFFASQMNGQ